MKSTSLLLLSFLFVFTLAFNTSPDTRYDWDKHEDGEELEMSLKNEPSVIFVVYCYKNADGKEALKLANDSLRTMLRNDLEKHDEVVFTEVDMSATNTKAETYNKLFGEKMGINPALLDDGPIVTVLNRGQGSWIHSNIKADPAAATDKTKTVTPGKDAHNEVLESVEIFLKEAKDRAQGGTGSVLGSSEARRGGGVSVGGSY